MSEQKQDVSFPWWRRTFFPIHMNEIQKVIPFAIIFCGIVFTYTVCRQLKDYLIVGAGVYGVTCARELTDLGFKCLVIDKRHHIAGNCYTEKVNNVDVHKYGAHIFHTGNEAVWNYVNRYTSFTDYKHSV